MKSELGLLIKCKSDHLAIIISYGDAIIISHGDAIIISYGDAIIISHMEMPM